MRGEIRRILEAYRPIWAIEHSSGVMAWDLETFMPEGGSRARGFSQGQLSVLKQKLVKGLEPMVSRAEKAKDLTDVERGIVRVLRRALDYYLRVPPSLLDELERAGTEATVPWRTSRKTSDFDLFKPYLAKMVHLKQEEAEKLGYDRHPYDALLNLYEEDLAVSDVDSVFSTLIPSLRVVLGRVEAEGRFLRRHPLEKARYDEAAMARVNASILDILKMPERTFRMGVSTHPFTIGLGRGDVRITTRYEGVNFKSTMYSVIHECGHAIYDLQYDEKLEFTPVSGGASTAVHESQSRFWENVVGRSIEFVRLIHPILRKNLALVSAYDIESIFQYFNTVRPSLIRVDADELTYNFHIAVRYEIEKKLMGGELSVSDIPAIWNDTMEEYLGVRPRKDSDGMLQDVHWSQGGFGYFPTYSLGNIISGMIRSKFGGRVRGLVSKGELGAVKDLLRRSIHRWGSVYSPKELLRREFRDGYNPEDLISYFRDKYLG